MIKLISDSGEYNRFESSLRRVVSKYKFGIGRTTTQPGYSYTKIKGNENSPKYIGSIVIEYNFDEYKNYPISLTIERSDGDEDTWYCTTFREALDYVDRWLHDEYDWFN